MSFSLVARSVREDGEGCVWGSEGGRNWPVCGCEFDDTSVERVVETCGLKFQVCGHVLVLCGSDWVLWRAENGC